MGDNSGDLVTALTEHWAAPGCSDEHGAKRTVRHLEDVRAYNAYAVAEANGRAEDLHEELVALFTSHNRSEDLDRTSLSELHPSARPDRS